MAQLASSREENTRLRGVVLDLTEQRNRSELWRRVREMSDSLGTIWEDLTLLADAYGCDWPASLAQQLLKMPPPDATSEALLEQKERMEACVGIVRELVADMMAPQLLGP